MRTYALCLICHRYYLNDILRECIKFINLYHCRKHFNSTRAYNQSKLAQAMFTKTLQEHFEEKKLPIMAFSVHPGIVNTDLFEHTYIKRYLSWVMQIFFKVN